MRIIAGSWRGRQLHSPSNPDIRPTSDKVRGAIFNILAHGAWPHALFDKNIRVLDGFCGSGALGLEALSRGAGYALFLDRSSVALQLAKENAGTLKADNTRFEMRDLSKPQHWRDEGFNLIFLDPPYRDRLGFAALAQLTEAGFAAEGAVAVIESAKNDMPAPVAGWSLHTRRAWGQTAATFLVRE